MVRDVLYFGLRIPEGGVITPEQWEAFLDEVVTPRFPDGFTVTDAEGQWRGKDGKIEEERSKVVTFLHSGDEPRNRAVEEVAAEYKRRFRQEAVLRERSTACTQL